MRFEYQSDRARRHGDEASSRLVKPSDFMLVGSGRINFEINDVADVSALTENGFFDLLCSSFLISYEVES